MVKGVMVKGLSMMVMMAWMMMKMVWIMFQSSPISWPLKVLEQLWVRFVFIFLKYEMETINAKYVIPFEYYKVQPFEKLSTMSGSTNTSNAPSLDLSNPLYLHPSDYPGMNLVSKSFDGSGFGAWKRAMTIALSAKNKLSFVTGVSSKPMDPSLILQWQRCNDMVISWILNALSKDISDSVLYTETTHQLWIELNERYGQTMVQNCISFKKTLCEISQGSSDIASYFTKIKVVWDELNAINPFPSCSCGVSRNFTKREEDRRLVQFLMGLNSSYDSIRGNILMMKPLPSISDAYAILVQDEKQREMNSTSSFVPESSSMNVTSQSSYSKFENKKSMICSHCKKPGHNANKCYRLVGFPKDFKFTKTKKYSANSSFDTIDQKESGTIAQSLYPGQTLTSDQIGELLQILQKSYNEKTGKDESVFNTANISQANFAGGEGEGHRPGKETAR